MKKIFYLLFYIASAAASAQSPQGIPYQAIARNASGVTISNTAVKVRFSIRDSIATGAIKYQETHSATTSALGLFSVNVGMGTVVSGTFSGINWGKNAKFLQVELNTTGGTTYTDLGTTQMMSVPYALQAVSIKMKTSIAGDTLYTGNGNYLLIPGLSAANPPLTDIDGNTYTKVSIGTQVWMKENLKVSKYRNGDPIVTGLTNTGWGATASGAYAVYNNDADNNLIYGKLYNWYAVVDSRGLCPSGWHVPADWEWDVLESNLGGASSAGGKLKAVSSLWSSPNTGATNSSGFTAFPGGYRNAADGTFGDIGNSGNWLSTTVAGTGSNPIVWSRTLLNGWSDSRRNGIGKGDGFSVRCLKD